MAVPGSIQVIAPTESRGAGPLDPVVERPSLLGGQPHQAVNVTRDISKGPDSSKSGRRECESDVTPNSVMGIKGVRGWGE